MSKGLCMWEIVVYVDDRVPSESLFDGLIYWISFVQNY